MRKGVASVVVLVMLLLGAVALIGVAYQWLSGNLSAAFGGLYPQDTFCTTMCIVDGGEVSRVLVPLDGDTVIKARVINDGAVPKSYVIKYYPNFTPELSLIAAQPVITVPASGSAFAEIAVKGLIVRNSDIDFNITAININDNKDNVSFGILTSVSTANVPDAGPAWFLLILAVSSALVYLKAG
ncbi:MAG: hypothetical protein HYS53_02740 [Candidatus Aenigmarchaeota archaeon]|nr:hypothetical protein [Candidatus Aenigmarchaeota archaeon]